MACSPDDIVCAISELTRAVHDIGPSGLDVAAFIVATVGTAGTLLVGIAALVSSRSATQIADAARKNAYDAGLDVALGEFVAAVAAYLAQVGQWRRRHVRWGGMVTRLAAEADVEPDTVMANATLEAARLRARDEDATVLEKFAGYWFEVRRIDSDSERDLEMGFAVTALREWRTGVTNAADTISLCEKNAARIVAGQPYLVMADEEPPDDAPEGD